MKAFDIDVGFGVIQPQMPSILAVVAADGRKRGNEFQNLSLITSMYGICTFIYTYFCHKNKSTYIYIVHECYGYHNRNFSLTDLNS